MSEKIVIDISPDGKTVQVEGVGFVGPECDRFMEVLDTAFGEVQRKELKPEYRQAATRFVPRGRGR